jgi:hypothetical protein
LALGALVLVPQLKVSPVRTVYVILAGATLALLFWSAFIQPRIISLGRGLALGAPESAAAARFWTLHVACTVLHSMKLPAGVALPERRVMSHSP